MMNPKTLYSYRFSYIWVGESDDIELCEMKEIYID